MFCTAVFISRLLVHITVHNKDVRTDLRLCFCLRRRIWYTDRSVFPLDSSRRVNRTIWWYLAILIRNHAAHGTSKTGTKSNCFLPAGPILYNCSVLYGSNSSSNIGYTTTRNTFCFAPWFGFCQRSHHILAVRRVARWSLLLLSRVFVKGNRSAYYESCCRRQDSSARYQSYDNITAVLLVRGYVLIRT